MAWCCPTIMRPERLARLAESWERNAPEDVLYVRIWADDPRRADYENIIWPDNFQLYSSDKKWLGAALNEFYHLHPGEPSYGFIADDIVLRTKGGIRILEETAGEWFVAYPNDTIQRERLPTHFCIGRKLLETVGFFIHPFFKHDFIDCVWHGIGLHTGLLRYCPQVIFEHQHVLNEKAVMDATYEEVNAAKKEGLVMWEKFVREQLPRVVKRVQAKLINEYERDWEAEDATLYRSAG